MAIKAEPTSSMLLRAPRAREPGGDVALDILDHDDRVVDTMPIASTRRTATIVQREANAAMMKKVPISETGIATSGMIAARQSAGT